MATGFEDKDRDLHFYVRAVRDAHANFNIALHNYLDGVLQDNLTDSEVTEYMIAEKELKRALLNLDNFQQVCELAKRFHEDLSHYDEEEE